MQIHRKDEKDLIKEERKKSKKAKIVEYDSNDKSLIISELINKYKVLDISKWKVNINTLDMKLVYTRQEHGNKNQERGIGKFNQNWNEDIPTVQSRFPLSTLVLNPNSKFNNKEHNCLKEWVEGRVFLYQDIVEKCTKMANKKAKNEFKDDKKINYLYKLQKHSLQYFPWGSNSEIKSLYRACLNDNNNKIKVTKWIHFKWSDMKWLSEDQQLAWERLYGSYLSLYFCENIPIEKQDKMIIKLTDRAKTIVYLIKNGSIDIKSHNEYMKRVLEFVVDSYAHDDKSRFSDLYVGAQEGFRYGKEATYKYPWEACYRLNSTYARLKVLHHHDELTSLSNFFNLDGGKLVLGNFKSKLVSTLGK